MIREQFTKETGLDFDGHLNEYVEWLENKTLKNVKITNALFNYAWNLVTDSHDYDMLLKIKNYYDEQ